MKMKQAHINTVSIPIERLIPHPENYNTHPDRQIKKLRHLIKTHGYAKGSVVFQASTHYVLCGHGILEALKLEGYTHVDAVELDVDGAKAEAFMIADNKIASDSVIDDSALQQLISQLSDQNVPSLDFGFDSKDLEDLASRILADSGGYTAEPQDDEIPETVEPITKTGDLWHLGSHRLLNGDSTKAEDIERLMGGVKADMVFTDPPYAVNYGHDQVELQKKSGGKFSKTRLQHTIQNDNLSTEECAEQLWKPSFKNMYDNADDECSFYMTMCQGGDQMMMMMMMMMSENWQIKHELIWVKSSAVFSMGRLDYDYQHEPILFGWKKKHNFYGNGQFTKSIWEIPKPNKSDLHPTMKPIELIANALLNSSKESDNVLDLFLGSGSTLIAAHKLGRICYGCEIDQHYCDVIVKRYIDFVGDDSSVSVERDGQVIGYKDLI
jgi:DNA modification methylase